MSTATAAALAAAEPRARAAARAARDAFRSGDDRATTGVAAGMTQANLVAVPREWAYDVLLFATRNPKPCPILEVLDAGQTESTLAPGSDIRTDIGRYRIWRDGRLDTETTDAGAAWADHPDLVSFLIGCSFTFETGLLAAGIPIRHQQLHRNVPMYRANQPCAPAGRIHGQLVVSMRPIPAGRVADAVRISARTPAVHGAPVHIGDPAALGIDDLDHPDFGDAPVIRAGEIPVFWACGVTPQAAIMASHPPFAVTHAPGHMFITDVPDTAYQV